MSQEFLHHLLSTIENRVHSAEVDATCMICLEKYNTLNVETGILEIEIRLPCGHGVGSSCIVTWLKTNNSCPACRATFFSAQARPYLEHGIMDVDEPSIPRTALDVRETVLIINAFVEFYAGIFGWNGYSGYAGVVATSIAESIARSRAPHSIDLRPRQTQRSVAAAGVYMALHLMRRPKNPDEIAARSPGVIAHQMVSIYRHIYPVRMQLLTAQTLEHVIGPHIEGMLSLLPSPAPDDRILDDEEKRRLLQHFALKPPGHWQATIDPFLAHIMELGGPRAETICQDIAKRIVDERHHGVHSQALVFGIGFYMASHLIGSGATLRRIGDMVNMNEHTVAIAYARVYPLRNQLIRPRILTYIGMENLPRAIDALPALDWPPLEVQVVARS